MNPANTSHPMPAPSDGSRQMPPTPVPGSFPQMPAPGKINYCIVTTNHGLNRMLVEIHKHHLTRIPPVLYVGLHGACSTLGWRGLISVLTIYVAPIKKVYIVDVLSMGIRCFSFESPAINSSIRGILESPSIPKVFFDLRNDSNTLFITCGIDMNAAHDLQLMGRARYLAISELASKQSLKENVKESSDSLTAESDEAFSGPDVEKSSGAIVKKRSDIIMAELEEAIFGPAGEHSSDEFIEESSAPIPTELDEDIASFVGQHLSSENIKKSSNDVTANPGEAISGSAVAQQRCESNKQNSAPIINPEVVKFRFLIETQERRQAAPPIPNGNADYFLQRPLRQGFVRQFLQPIVCRPQLWEMYYDLPAYYLECYTMWLGIRIEWSRSPGYDPRRNA